MSFRLSVPAILHRFGVWVAGRPHAGVSFVGARDNGTNGAHA
jgi:hypothetical protein